MSPRNQQSLKPLAVLAIVIAATTADQLSKSWAVRGLSNGHAVSILPTLEFDLSYNSGFSFGTGSGQGRIIGIGVILLCGFLIYRIAREPRTSRVILLSIILGGALGNLWDRVFRADSGFLSGHVVDFIDVSWFAVFNLADICVVGGALLFVIFEFFDSAPDATPPEAKQSDGQQPPEHPTRSR